MARKMCPKCGSRDTAHILWGMPVMSSELEDELENGRVVLGGCCVPMPEPRYHCNKCKDNFAYRRTGPEAYSGDMLSTGIIKKFHCSIGGFFGRNYVCGIDIEKYGLNLRYVSNEGIHYDIDDEGFAQSDIKIEIPLSEDNLIKFTFEIMKCYPDEWKKKYVNKDILDGYSWELEMELDTGEKISSYGINEDAPYWNSLIRVLRKKGIPKFE